MRIGPLFVVAGLALVVGCGQRHSSEETDPSLVIDSQQVARSGAPVGVPTGQVGRVEISVGTAVPSWAPRSDDPYAWIHGGYVLRVGRSVTIDGSGSYAREGRLVSYAWDFNNDGVPDRKTRTPVITQRFTRPFIGVVVLTVTDDAGRTATATAQLAVTDDGDVTPRDDDNCPNAANPGHDDFDNDRVGNMCDDTPG